MTEKHKRDSRGFLEDDVRMDALTSADRDAYARAASDIGRTAVPRMFTASNPHARLYVANFDGTGNDLDADPEHVTNVGKIHRQLEDLSARDSRVWSDYVEGAGTQEGAIARTIDGATGRSYDERIETMYRLFSQQAARWIKTDPQADIRLVATGFSRGAEQAAGFIRMVNERGVQDFNGRVIIQKPFGRDSFDWTLPALRSPGKTLTSEILFDPVGTGTPNNHDRQPTGSTVSALQITARDERRNAFPSTQILPPGRSPDGRFVGVTVPGAHSDIGGSYHRNGLSTLNFNLAADFLNAHSDVPLVNRLPEPTDPSMYVIHHSEDHMWFYGTSEFRRDGQRDIMGAQASPPHCREVIACAPPDPFDRSLAPLVGPRFPVGVHGTGQDLRDSTHRDHGMYHSASVQVRELHVRSGFDLKPDQVDRLTAGLVIEAKRNGMTAITDVEFGPEAAAGRPTLQAIQGFDGRSDDPGSKRVGIDALSSLDVPLGVSNQQLQAMNQTADMPWAQSQSQSKSQSQSQSQSRPQPQPQPQPLPVEVEQQQDRSAMGPAMPAAGSATPTAGAEQPGPGTPPSQATTNEQRDTDGIRQLQHNLNTIGVRDMAGKPLVASGVYDMTTQTAVARFQSEHALPVTGVADDATRTTIQGRAFIADLQQPGQVQVARGEPVQADVARSFTATDDSSHPRSDPRHPDSPDQALYKELQRCIPDASQDRLLQFTAACRANMITAKNLSEVHLDEDKLTLSFHSTDPLATPAKIDLNQPPPEPGQSIGQIQQFDQQTSQVAQRGQQQGAPMAQQGMVM